MTQPTQLNRARTATTADAGASVLAAVGLSALLLAALVAVSYPLLAVGVLLGIVGTVVCRRLVAAVSARPTHGRRSDADRHNPFRTNDAATEYSVEN